MFFSSLEVQRHMVDCQQIRHMNNSDSLAVFRNQAAVPEPSVESSGSWPAPVSYNGTEDQMTMEGVLHIQI